MPEAADRAEIGRRGEECAVRLLERLGFGILERNWRHGRYEIDIIARKGGEVHIVEVKCRALGSLTTAEEAYTPEKFTALVKAAAAYLEQNGIDADTRFSLVAVTHSGKGYSARLYPDIMVPSW